MFFGRLKDVIPSIVFVRLWRRDAWQPKCLESGFFLQLGNILIQAPKLDTNKEIFLGIPGPMTGYLLLLSHSAMVRTTHGYWYKLMFVFCSFFRSTSEGTSRKDSAGWCSINIDMHIKMQL